MLRLYTGRLPVNNPIRTSQLQSKTQFNPPREKSPNAGLHAVPSISLRRSLSLDAARSGRPVAGSQTGHPDNYAVTSSQRKHDRQPGRPLESCRRPRPEPDPSPPPTTTKGRLRPSVRRTVGRSVATVCAEQTLRVAVAAKAPHQSGAAGTCRAATSLPW